MQEDDVENNQYSAETVTGTEVSQVLVKCRWKAKQHKHLQQA